MGSFFSQLAAVFILRTDREVRHGNRKFPKNGTSQLFSASFFQLWKAKLGKYKRVEEKWLFIHFPLIFCHNLAKNQLLCTFFLNISGFCIFRPPKCQKVMISSKKRPFKFISDFNNQQNLLIFGLVTAFRNQKIL